MALRLGVVMDPIENITVAKDSSLAMLLVDLPPDATVTAPVKLWWILFNAGTGPCVFQLPAAAVALGGTWRRRLTTQSHAPEPRVAAGIEVMPFALDMLETTVSETGRT